jgi:hypothetical protein
MPSARGEAAEQRGLGGRVVEVERLRVVSRGEREHLLARDAIGAERSAPSRLGKSSQK